MICVVRVVYTGSGSGNYVEQVPYFISKAFSFFEMVQKHGLNWMDVGRFGRFWMERLSSRVWSCPEDPLLEHIWKNR